MSTPRRLCRSASALLVTGALLVSCVPPEPDADLAKRYPADTTMGVIQRTGELRVGVPPAPPWTVLGPDGEPAEGFAVDHAEHLAATLGVETVYEVGPPHRLLQMITEEQLDVAFPPFGMTERLLRQNPTYSDVIYVAHQRFLAPRDIPLDDLAGARLCSLVERRTEVRIHRVAPDAEVIEAPCEGEFDAATGLDIRLIRFRIELQERCETERPPSPEPPGNNEPPGPGVDLSPEPGEASPVPLPSPGEAAPPPVEMPEVVEAAATWLCDGPEVGMVVRGEQLSTEGVAASLIRRSDLRGTGGFPTFVNEVWEQFREDGHWETTYERWLAPHVEDPVAPPEMTAREAAALYPIQARPGTRTGTPTPSP